MSDQPDNTRCILFTPPGRGRSGDLTATLRSRAWDTVTFSDPALAMAELCLEDRTQSARTAWGLRPSRRLALVIASPDPAAAPDGAGPLVDAVHRYLPGVEVYRSNGSDLRPEPPPGNPPAAAVVPTRTASGGPVAAPIAEPVPGLPPPGERDDPRLTTVAARVDADDADAAEDDGPVEITREEIDMLFAYGDETREP